MARKRIRYSVGDVFVIPSSSGAEYFVQIVADTKMEIGAPFCYVYSRDAIIGGCGNGDLRAADVLSASFITPELIESGYWKMLANKPVPVHVAVERLNAARNCGFVGSIIVGGGLVPDYLDTFYGAISNDHWPDPSYVYRFFLKKPADGAGGVLDAE